MHYRIPSHGVFVPLTLIERSQIKFYRRRVSRAGKTDICDCLITINGRK